MREFFFDIAHGVVAKVTDQPAAKTRQLRCIFDGRDFETREIFFDVIQRVGNRALFCNCAACKFRALIAADFDARFRSESNKRIPSETLAADHGFEQVGIRLVGELEVDRQRRVEIGKRLQHEGDAVVTRLREPRKFGFSHALQSID